MLLRYKSLLVLLFLHFLLCFPTFLKAQSLDSLLISEITKEVFNWAISLENTSNLYIKTDDFALKQSLEAEFLKNGIHLNANQTNDSKNVEVSHKGSVKLTKIEVELDGVVLIRLDSANVLLDSKRIIIHKKMASAGFEASTLHLWTLEEPNESNSSQWKTKILEPAIILSAMALSIYLLFAVRS